MEPGAKTDLIALYFTSDIERLTQDFTGRRWLQNEVDAWLKRKGERFFILTGEPGVGKSAFAAWLTNTRKDITAYNFCIAGRNATITPGSVLRSLGAQLGDSLEGYGEALANTIKPEHLTVNVDIKVEKMTGGEITGVVINHLHAGDLQEVFDILLRAPLAELAPPSEPIFILIDSLDEAVTFAGKTNLVTLLAGAGDLPSWVRFLCTSRPERRVLSYFDGLRPHALAAESQMNQEDTNQYIVNRVKRERLQTQLRSSNTPSQELVDQMRKLSKGNFLYTKVLIDDIEAGRQPLDDLEALPKSLDDIYHGFLRRFTPAEWSNAFQPILGVLVVSQEAVTETQLANFTGVPETKMRQHLGVLLQFLDVIENEDEETYQIYHQSLRDYLLDKKRSKDFWCAATDGHQAIADYYLRHHEGKWLQCDAYGLRHLPFHLSSTEQIEILKKLLLDFNWMWAKLNAIDVNAVIDDFDLLPDDRVLRLVQGAIRMSAHVLKEDGSQLAGHLLGRLMSFELPEIVSLLKGAKAWRAGPWLRPLTPSLRAPGQQLIYTLTGHGSTVRAVAITPDGKKAVSASADSLLMVWDLKKGTELHRLEGHTDQIYTVALTSDGRMAVSGSNDSAIMCWDVENGTKIGTLSGHEGFVRAVAVTPDGKQVVSSAADATVKVWDLEALIPVRQLPGHDGYFHALSVSPDGKILLVAEGSKIIVWDLEKASKVCELTGHEADVSGLAMIPGCNQAISAAQDKTLIVWDLDTGAIVHKLSGHKGGVNGVAVMPSGRQAISASEDFTLMVWDLALGEKVLALGDHNENVKAVAVTQDGARAVSSASDGTLKVWDMREAVRTPLPNDERDQPTVSWVLPEGRRALSVTDENDLLVWDLESRQKLSTHFGFREPVRRMTVTPNGRYVLLARGDDVLELWDLEIEKAKILSRGLSGDIHHVSMSADGKKAVSATWDGKLTVWDLEKGKASKRMSTKLEAVRRIVITTDGHRAVVLNDTALTVWDLKKGLNLFRFPDDKQLATEENIFIPPTGLPSDVTPTGHRAIFALPDSLSVIDLTALAIMHRLSYAYTGAVAISADGRRAVSANGKGLEHMVAWDLDNGTRLFNLAGHFLKVTGLDISPDGRFAVSVAGFGFDKQGGAPDLTLKVWDLDSGVLLTRFTGETSLQTCSIMGDGLTIMTGPHVLRLEVFKR